uniref:Lysosomal-associated membrane protein 2 n=1 Tax=Neogobius melanostomus TaxID=47308 RepID=A0A8C6SPR2_9GOBI
MSRYSAFLLFLVVVPWIFCAADPVDYPEYDITTTTTAAPKTTTAAPTTTTTTTRQPPTTTAPTTPPPPRLQPPPPPPRLQQPLHHGSNNHHRGSNNNHQFSKHHLCCTKYHLYCAYSYHHPAPPLPKPTAHLYKVTKGNDSCLMVNFGLRIGFQGDKYEEMNFEYSNKTAVTGSCDEDNSTLVIQADTLKLTLTFHNDTKKFSLRALNATGTFNSGVTFSETNSNLTLWQASLGNSYMCNKEQIYNITKSLKVFTFDLQVQPFGVKKDSFSTAEDCMAGESFIVPIAVGVALLVLILIVLVAYFIGRKRNMASGYESF